LKIPYSGKPTPTARFDPAQFERFAVIRCDYRFDGDPEALPGRLFVFLDNATLDKQALALCVKATSKVEAYLNNPKKMQGAVFYKGGVLPCFPKDTIIQPENLLPIPHLELIRNNAQGKAAVVGVMPPDFMSELLKAVHDSVTMSPKLKKRILSLLGDD
jgi:hypothetical protein